MKKSKQSREQALDLWPQRPQDLDSSNQAVPSFPVAAFLLCP